MYSVQFVKKNIRSLCTAPKIFNDGLLGQMMTSDCSKNITIGLSIPKNRYLELKIVVLALI